MIENKTVFYLETCSTCKRIISELNIDNSWVFREIKSAPITEQELEKMNELSKSYEALFSKRSRKYRELNLKEQTLTELDYKQYILQEYTFLKRPVFVVNSQIFIGNSKKNVEQLKSILFQDDTFL